MIEDRMGEFDQRDISTIAFAVGKFLGCDGRHHKRLQTLGSNAEAASILSWICGMRVCSFWKPCWSCSMSRPMANDWQATCNLSSRSPVGSPQGTARLLLQILSDNDARPCASGSARTPARGERPWKAPLSFVRERATAGRCPAEVALAAIAVSEAVA